MCVEAPLQYNLQVTHWKYVLGRLTGLPLRKGRIWWHWFRIWVYFDSLTGFEQSCDTCKLCAYVVDTLPKYVELFNIFLHDLYYVDPSSVSSGRQKTFNIRNTAKERLGLVFSDKILSDGVSIHNRQFYFCWCMDLSLARSWNWSWNHQIFPEKWKDTPDC